MSTAKFNQWLNPDGTENYKCRAWVNFDGTGTVAIRASGNVASITDNGTGSYTINLTNALNDTNGVAVANGKSAVGTPASAAYFDQHIFTEPTAAGAVSVWTGWNSGTASYGDFAIVEVAVFR